MKSNLISFLKRNTFPIISILFFTICYIVYINKSTANIMFQDQYDLMYIIDKYFTGELTISDLWRGHLEHRLFGYNLIFLLNAILFHYNSYFEFYLGALSLIITSIIIYARFHRIVVRDSSQKKMLFYVTFIMILLLIFSLNQWENMVFSLGMYILLKMCFFVPVFFALDDLLIKENKLLRHSVLLFTWLGLSILVFGAGYSLAMVGSIILVMLFRGFVIKWNFQKRDIWIYLFILITAALFILFYYYNIYENNMVMDRESNLDKIVHIFHNWPSAIKYVLLSFSASIFGVNFSDRYLSQNISIILGIVVLLIYFYSLYIYVKSKMYLKTYIPLLFIFYSFLVYGMILVGRFDYGTSYGMASRYVTETQLGLIGSIWIITIYLFKFKRVQLSNIKCVIPLLCLAFIGVGQISTNLEEIRTSPYRKEYFVDLQRIALNIENASEEEISKFQYPEPLVREGIQIIKKYELSIFNDYKETDKSDTEIEIKGLYSHEGSGQWMGKEASIVYKDITKSSLTIKGTVPTAIADNTLEVLVNGEKLVAESLKPGVFNIELTIPSSESTEIQLKLDKTFIPKDIGLNEDQRELGLFIEDLQIK